MIEVQEEGKTGIIYGNIKSPKSEKGGTGTCGEQQPRP